MDLEGTLKMEDAEGRPQDLGRSLFCLRGAIGHLGGCSDGWWVSVAGRYLRLPMGYGGLLRMLCFSLSLLG